MAYNLKTAAEKGTVAAWNTALSLLFRIIEIFAGSSSAPQPSTVLRTITNESSYFS